MSITVKRDQIAEIVREIKEDKVRSTHNPDRLETNIHNVVHGWRGDEPVIAIFPSGLSSHSALYAARNAAFGFGCDTLALTTETYQAGTSTSPLTGKRWTSGEMQRVADEHGGLETGSVIEALVTHVVNRAGDTSGISQQYRIHRCINALNITSYDIEWLPEITDASASFGGLAESLVHMMNEPPIDAQMARDGVNLAAFGLNAEQVRTHVDCGVVKALYQSGFEGAILLLADESSQRAEIIKESLGEFSEEIDSP